MIVVIIVAVAAWLFSGSKNEEQIDFKREAVTTQTLQNSVTATGTIEAVTSVTVGTQVSGIVNKLYVDYNSQVKKGEVIAELDKTNLMSELNTAKANLASAQSSLNYQSANMSRYQTLYKKDLVSADDYENALLTYRQARASSFGQGKCTESPNQPELCYNYIPNRWNCHIKKRRGRTDRSSKLQHTRALYYR